MKINYKTGVSVFLTAMSLATLSAQTISFERVPRTIAGFTGTEQGSIAFADVDGDGDQDVLITGTDGSDNLSSGLYTNNGSGGFSRVSGRPFREVSVSSIAFADVDNDGDQDVLITGLSSVSGFSMLYTNDGSGNFRPASATFTGVATGSIAFADVDNDGDQDVLITGEDSNNNFISELYTNDGFGNFSLVSGTPFRGVFASSTAFADVDSDGDQDVLITGGDNNFNRISELYTNDGSGNFSRVNGTPFTGVRGGSIAFADVDGDDDQDVLITGNGFSNLYTNDGSGNFSLVSGTPFTGVSGGSIAFADVDSDGDQDVLITGQDGNRDPIGELYANDGLGNFSLVSGTPFIGVDVGFVAFADVDGDNDQDVLITGRGASLDPIAFLYRNTTCITTTAIDTLVTCDSLTWIDGVTYFADNDTATFTLTNAAGCDSVVTLNLTVVNFDLEITIDTSLTEGTVTAMANEAGITYRWFDCSNNTFTPISGETNQAFTIPESGSYAVELTQNGCVDTSECVNLINVSIAENTLTSNLRFYPNPTSGEFNLELGKEYAKLNLIVRNALGQQVAVGNYNNTKFINLTIEGEAGLYFVELTANNNLQTVLKFVKN